MKLVIDRPFRLLWLGVVLALFPNVLNAAQPYSGGGIGRRNQSYSLAEDQKQQQRLESFFVNTETVVQEFNTLSVNFHNRVRAIIEDGASCLISENKYYAFRDNNMYGESHRKTRWWKKTMSDCYKTRQYRLDALRNIDSKFLQLKAKVEELDYHRKMALDQANQIKYRIDQIQQDRNLIHQINNYNYK